jgi:hypothetical protein
LKLSHVPQGEFTSRDIDARFLDDPVMIAIKTMWPLPWRAPRNGVRASLFPTKIVDVQEAGTGEADAGDPARI